MHGANRIRALVVENDEKWCKAMAIAVERLGCAVRKVADAQLAIDVLIIDKNISILILDWDLRGSSQVLPTALGEDVLREVICHRPDLIVAIVTGAIFNPDYIDWRKELFDIVPRDDLIRMMNWHPFVVIQKTGLVSEEYLESELRCQAGYCNDTC